MLDELDPGAEFLQDFVVLQDFDTLFKVLLASYSSCNLRLLFVARIRFFIILYEPGIEIWLVQLLCEWQLSKRIDPVPRGPIATSLATVERASHF